MTLDNDLAAKIKRLHYSDKWPIGTIAAQLNVHHSAVRRIIELETLEKAPVIRRSMIDPYLPFILDTLEKYPKLTASRLFHMVRERGYPGKESHFRDLIARHRPAPPSEAFFRLRTLPGEQMQCDWADFGTLEIGRARRKLMGFVMVLSYSRKIFLRFFFDARMANFLRAHHEAFVAFGGVPRVILYDNLKSAVIQREGAAIQFNPEILKFSAHYRFEAKPVQVRKPTQKGRVERAIRYIRDAFFAGREFVSLDELNQQAHLWCQGPAADRLCPGDQTITVRAAYEAERPRLQALPDNPYPTEERVEVSAAKTPYIRFDENDYTIPHTHVQRDLTVFADDRTLRVVDGVTLIATHIRSYDKGAQVEIQEHLDQLLEQKRKAKTHRGIDRLTQAIPLTEDFLVQAAEAGYSLRPLVRGLEELLERHPAAQVQSAMAEALDRGVPHINAVQLTLDRQLEDAQKAPPVAVRLTAAQRARDVIVTPHDLKTYDQLTGGSNGDQ